MQRKANTPLDHGRQQLVDKLLVLFRAKGQKISCFGGRVHSWWFEAERGLERLRKALFRQSEGWSASGGSESLKTNQCILQFQSFQAW